MGDTPFIHGRVKYSTDKCGKIGKDKLMFLVDGFYGTEKRAWDRADATRAQVGPSSVAAKFDDDDVDSWGVHGSFVLPILSEKKENKAGSLALSAYGFITQNPGYMDPYGIGSGAVGSYYRTGGDFVANVIHGWGPQVYFYITNEFMVDLFYAEVKANQSKRYQNKAGADTLEKIQQYGIVFSYDPNPALKFTLAWNYNKADYTKAVTGLGNEGKANVFRFAAYYFF
jgi:predicted porin